MLLALSDPMHIHHEAGHRWFAAGVNPPGPLVRSQKTVWFGSPAIPTTRIVQDVPAVLAILRQFCATAGHHFWSEDVSIRCSNPVRSFLIPRLPMSFCWVAIHKGGSTFDQRISTAAVQGGGTLIALKRQSSKRWSGHHN